MKYKLIPLLLLILVLYSHSSDAIIKKTIIREKILKCDITHNNAHRLPRPYKFQKSNNLLKRSTDMFFAEGKAMIIEGYILDRNCVPITNAIIKMWQLNNLGLNQNNLHARNLVKDLNKLDRHDSHFIGNGVTTSDNTGYYRFISLYPEDSLCDRNHCAKDFDLIVSHNKFNNFAGNIFIDAKLDNDVMHVAKFAGYRDDINIYRFDVVLKEKSHYRKY